MSDATVDTAAAQDQGSGSKTPLATPPSPAPTELVQPAHTLQTRRKTYRTRATCPDPGSLYDLLRENCGKSLFVLPILWTDIHPRLLRTEFIAQEPAASDTASNAASNAASDAASNGTRAQPSSADEDLRSDLTALLSALDMRPSVKSRAIKNVLSSLFQTPFSRPKSNSDLDLHFGDRVFRKAVRIPVLWTSPGGAGSSFDSAATRAMSSFGHSSSSARENNDLRGMSFTHSFTHSSSQGGSGSVGGGALDGPTVAYINRSHLAMIRQNLFRIVRGPNGGDESNRPVSRLQYLRSKQLMPGEPDRDPYLMGVFLGMAQAHFYDSPSPRAVAHMMWWNNGQRSPCRTAPVAEFRDVKLRIVTHDDDTSDFMVYTTTVTAEFLKKFAEPTKNTAASDADARGMTIEYERVPMWPIVGLRARLGKALGRDLVGDMEDDAQDDKEVETTSDESAAKGSQGSSASKADKADKSDAGQPEPKNGLFSDEQRGSRVDSLKRKRGERKSYAEVLSGGGSGGSGSGSKEDGTKEGSSATVTSPMSPRTKRRRTRSLSSSSLAVC